MFTIYISRDDGLWVTNDDLLVVDDEALAHEYCAFYNKRRNGDGKSIVYRYRTLVPQNDLARHFLDADRKREAEAPSTTPSHEYEAEGCRADS